MGKSGSLAVYEKHFQAGLNRFTLVFHDNFLRPKKLSIQRRYLVSKLVLGQQYLARQINKKSPQVWVFNFGVKTRGLYVASKTSQYIVLYIISSSTHLNVSFTKMQVRHHIAAQAALLKDQIAEKRLPLCQREHTRAAMIVQWCQWGAAQMIKDCG